MKRAVFRFDAGPTLGAGHAARCLTLADGLAAAGWDIAFAVGPGTVEVAPALKGRVCHALAAAPAEEAAEMGSRVGPCDLLVVDHYGRDAEFERACRAFAKRVLVIDDLADRPHDCDWLLDPTLGRQAANYAPLMPKGCRLLLGPDHALLDPRFAMLRPESLSRRRRLKGPVRLLVSFGGTDPHDLSARALDAAARASLPVSIDVVLGTGASGAETVRAAAARLGGRAMVAVGVTDMPARMAAADLALGAAGGTSWERCCLGLPALVVIVADNQRLIAAALAEAGAAEVLGDHADVDAAAIAAALSRLCADPARLAAMSARAAAVCDGLGVRRVVQALVD